ncbi:MAG: glycosyltransferase [Candidatus Rokubacteria bacterium]|nr:glycosyltransferase [Candidatus Rokubacteria bacterium]
MITRLTLGGSSENTIASIAALSRAGYACTLAAGLGESDPAVVTAARGRAGAVLDVPSLGREMVPSRDLAALGALLHLIRRERPAIVHTHTSKAGFLGRLAARILRVSGIIHQPHGHIFYGYYGPRRTALYVGLERLAARWTDRMVTLTERGTEEHLALGIGQRAQFVTVPSGVALAEMRAAAPTRSEARRRLDIAPGAFVMVAVGRLVPVKGFDVLIAALPRVRREVDVSGLLLLVGDGPGQAGLEASARGLGVGEMVRFTGATAEVALHLAAADVLVAPSRNEGMGRVLVEAMALGLPVVGSAVGGVPIVLDHGRAGRLVPAGDRDALAAVLIELARDPRLRANLGAAGRTQAEAFSADTMATRMVELYDDLVKAKGLR